MVCTRSLNFIRNLLCSVVLLYFVSVCIVTFVLTSEADRRFSIISTITISITITINGKWNHCVLCIENLPVGERTIMMMMMTIWKNDLHRSPIPL